MLYVCSPLAVSRSEVPHVNALAECLMCFLSDSSLTKLDSSKNYVGVFWGGKQAEKLRNFQNESKNFPLHTVTFGRFSTLGVYEETWWGEHGTLLCFLDSEDVARFLFHPKSYFQTLVVGAGRVQHMISPSLNAGVVHGGWGVHLTLQQSAEQLNYDFICQCKMSSSLWGVQLWLDWPTCSRSRSHDINILFLFGSN